MSAYFYPEGNEALPTSDTHRCWVKISAIGWGTNGGGGGSGFRILQEDSSAILEEDDATALRKEG